MYNGDNPEIILIVTREPFYYYYHLSCYKLIATLHGNIVDGILFPDCTQNLDGYNNLALKHKKLVNDILFPKLVDDSIKYQLRLPKYNISDLDLNQLIIQLQLRDIEIFDQTIIKMLKVKKEEAMDRLQTFLENEQCQNKHKLLVYGFCNHFSRIFNITFPQYLIRFVLLYGPLYIHAKD